MTPSLQKEIHDFFSNQPKYKSNHLKRLFDIIFSAIILILLSPLFLILSCIVYSTSKGPIFYSSKRISVGGKVIYCWKFRTMHKNADQKLHQLLSSHPKLKEEWDLHHKLKKDPRITKIGSFLRKTSLDELPQFWNVLKGDLSTVGPRPLSEEEVYKVILQGKGKMFSVKPGITGLWQTSGRSLISFQNRILLEEQYAENHSFFIDIKLILKTILIMIFPKGAY